MRSTWLGVALCLSCSPARQVDAPALDLVTRSMAPLVAERAPFTRTGQGFRALRVEVLATAERGVRFEGVGCSVDVRPLDVAPSVGVERDRAVTFARVAPDTDEVIVATGTAFEELRVLRSRRAPTTFRWSIASSATTRLREGAIELVDARGYVCARAEPLFAIDAAGRRRELEVRLEGPTLIAHLDDRELQHPIVVDPRWTAAASMGEGRTSFLSVLLTSGDVLIAGGGRSSAEIYNPKTNSWRNAAPLPEVRGWADGVRLPDGKVLLVGGSPAYLYDPATDKWTSAGAAVESRIYANVAALPGGKVLVFGGYGAFSTAEVWDSATGFTATGTMKVARDRAPSTALKDGRVMAIGGGYTGNSTCEAYDPTTGTWSSLAPMPFVVPNSAVATTIDDGRVVVAGSDPTLVYQPTTNTWTVAPVIPYVRYGHTVTRVGNNKAFVAAGRNGSGGLIDSRIFDPATMSWSSSYNITVARDEHRATLLADGRIMVAGGSGFMAGTSVEIFAATPNGSPCSSGFTCDSAYCVDGVCCDWSCTESCHACDVTGKLGTCSPVSGDPHGYRACTGGFSCNAGACRTTCADDGGCRTGFYCNGSACTASRALGEACTRGRECLSGSCVDGVCCDSACTDQCAACDVAGKKGTCTPVLGAPHGARTACSTTPTTCGLICDGADSKACHVATTSVVCAATGCKDGLETHANNCDGMGACLDVAKSCGAYACGSITCRTDCVGKVDCAPGHYCKSKACVPVEGLGTACSDGSTCSSGYCVDGVCCAEASCGEGRSCATSKKGTCAKINGATCASDDQCGSATCVDGVCCESRCAGTCEACDVAGQLGRCVAVSGAPHGARTGCKATSEDPCTEGRCDGVEATKCVAFVGSEVSCRKRSCVDGTVEAAASCNGSGACPAAVRSSCEGFACDEAGPSCKSSCAADTDCRAGYACADGKCAPGGARCSDDGRSAIGSDGVPSSCAPFVCRGNKCLDRCGGSSECAQGFFCDNGRCVAAAASEDEGGCATRAPRGGSSAMTVLVLGLLLLGRRRCV